MNLFKTPETRWLWQAFPGSDLRCFTERRPNWWFRLWQRWTLGFVWTKA